MDCTLGYHHIALSSEVQKKSAFVTLLCTLEFKKVPFDLAHAPMHFQQLINDVAKDLPFAFEYLNEILVFYKKNIEIHFKHLRIIFDRLRAADLKLKRKRCDPSKCELYYLGHLISGRGIYLLPEKLQSIKDLPVP